MQIWVKKNIISFSFLHFNGLLWDIELHKSVVHWEKFYTRETEVRIEVVQFQSQLVVQIEQFVFFNEIEWWDWAD